MELDFKVKYCLSSNKFNIEAVKDGLTFLIIPINNGESFLLGIFKDNPKKPTADMVFGNHQGHSFYFVEAIKFCENYYKKSRLEEKGIKGCYYCGESLKTLIELSVISRLLDGKNGLDTERSIEVCSSCFSRAMGMIDWVSRLDSDDYKKHRPEIDTSEPPCRKNGF